MVLQAEMGHCREHAERDHQPGETGWWWPVRSRQRDSRQEEEQPARATRGDPGFSADHPASDADVPHPEMNPRPRAQHDQRPARLTARVCGWAALLTLVLALTSVPHLRGRDVPFIVFALTPYLVLASLARMGCFAVGSWMFHAVAEHRMPQRFTVIVVPLLQLAIVAPIALITFVGGQHGLCPVALKLESGALAFAATSNHPSG